MSRYLLDTCTISDLFSGNASVRRRFFAQSPDQIVISAVTVMEIQYGFILNAAVKRKYLSDWESLCLATEIIPFDEPAAEVAAQIRSELKSKGTPIGSFDLLIGATAKLHGLVMTTSNVREFKRIDGLLVENWRSTS